MLFLVAAVVGLTQSPASAHNSLVESNPKDGAALASVPIEWVLTFKNDVPLNSASAEVIDESGVRTALPVPRHGVDQKQIIFSLPQNLTGVVTARWKLVSTDGHVVTERVTFTVGITETPIVGEGAAGSTTLPAVATASVQEGESSAPEVLRYSLRLAGYAAVLAYGGLVLNQMIVGSRLSSLRSAQNVLRASTVALAVVPFLQLLVLLDDTTGRGLASSVPRFLDAFDTTAGSMLLARTVIGALIAFVATRGEQMTSWSVHSLSVLYLFALAYVGHSRSMAWPFVGVPVDVVHTASVAAWLGGLSVFVLVALPGMAAEESLEAFRRFGTVAQRAVILIVITGVIQTFRLHTTLVTLVTETHGRWLLVKLLVVGAMLKVGDINRKRVAKSLPSSENIMNRHVALVRRASVTEVAVGGVVMLLTTVLVTSSFG